MHAYTPGPPLSDFVDLMWAYDDHNPQHSMERLLPTGTMELVINLRGERLRVYESIDRYHYITGPLIAGVQSRHFFINNEPNTSVIGVHFHAGGAFPFLGLPAGEVHNAQLSLDALWGADAHRLHERLVLAPDTSARFRILESCLLGHAKRPLYRHRAVGFALTELGREVGAPSMASMADRAGISKRRFIRVFEDEVGLTPKRYQRIKRFQDAVRVIAAGGEHDWVDIALACGFYDQAHFNRDFREFTGLTPSDYAARQTDHMNHVPAD